MTPNRSATAQGVPVITLIGAGSRSFSFSMCTDICQTPQLKGAEVRLVDIHPGRLEKARGLFQAVSDATQQGLKLAAFADRTEALPGSKFVIVAVAEDRIERWDKDLSISRRHGIVEAQGECGGPGGLSLTLRNIPLMLEIARSVESLAPDATCLNYR